MNFVKTMLIVLAAAILYGCASTKGIDGEVWCNGITSTKACEHHRKAAIELDHEKKMNEQEEAERELATAIMKLRMFGGDKKYAGDVSTPAGLSNGIIYNSSEKDVVFRCVGPRLKSWMLPKKSFMRTELPVGEYTFYLQYLGKVKEAEIKILVDYQEDEVLIGNEKKRAGWLVVAGPPVKR